MNIYLDIDQTILTKDKKPATNLKQFLIDVLEMGDVYWLTTHCRENDAEPVLKYLQPVLNEELMNLVAQIKPTGWSTLKTEAIDFTQPFVWFDDYLMYAEKSELEKHQCLENWVEVKLGENNNIQDYIS